MQHMKMRLVPDEIYSIRVSSLEWGLGFDSLRLRLRRPLTVSDHLERIFRASGLPMDSIFGRGECTDGDIVPFASEAKLVEIGAKGTSVEVEEMRFDVGGNLFFLLHSHFGS